jgi:cell wall-associated NlpC family hydrolase
LRVVSPTLDSTDARAALKIRLCEDHYSGWLALQDLDLIQEAATPYCPIALSVAEIQARLPKVIAFAQAQMAQPNFYLWGGTVGPNYDCSGLVQRSFSASGIWLPRDAYQQEAFTQPIPNPSGNPATLIPSLEPGDLIFFGPPQKATHVGIYLGEGNYIHSSGEDQGRNGIGIDQLTDQGDTVSRTYYQQLRGAGRVITCYQPQMST